MVPNFVSKASVMFLVIYLPACFRIVNPRGKLDSVFASVPVQKPKPRKKPKFSNSSHLCSPY